MRVWNGSILNASSQKYCVQQSNALKYAQLPVTSPQVSMETGNIKVIFFVRINKHVWARLIGYISTWPPCAIRGITWTKHWDSWREVQHRRSHEGDNPQNPSANVFQTITFKISRLSLNIAIRNNANDKTDDYANRSQISPLSPVQVNKTIMTTCQYTRGQGQRGNEMSSSVIRRC